MKNFFGFVSIFFVVEAQTSEILKFLTSLGSCLKTYPNLSIFGNDLTQIVGTSSQCCLHCQQNQACKAWTWDTSNGGTCWLKSATQPLSKINLNRGSVISGIMSPLEGEVYGLNQSFDATNFFDQHWNFDEWGLTNMTKNVNQYWAKKMGMIGYQDGKVGDR